MLNWARRQAGATDTAVIGSVKANIGHTKAAAGVAGLINGAGNVLALMPHPERDALGFMHSGPAREAARGDAAAMLAPSSLSFSAIARPMP